MKILLAATEFAPMASTGDLGDSVAGLAVALRSAGVDARVIMPRYRAVSIENAKEVLGGLPVSISGKAVYGRVLEVDSEGVPVYLIDQPDYFDRSAFYGGAEKPFADNAERFVFFSRAIVEFARRDLFRPDLIHSHDWFTGLVPVYMRTLYADDKAIEPIRSVFSIHSLDHQGIFWHYDMHLTGLPWTLFRFDKLEFHGRLNFLKGGVVYADRVVTDSARFAEEIRTPDFGCGLDGILSTRGQALLGIRPGIDPVRWDPEKDSDLAENYSVERPSGRMACRRDLERLANLPESDAPLLFVPGPLIERRGADLLPDALRPALEKGLQVIIVGEGERRFLQYWEEESRRRPMQVSVMQQPSESMKRKAYAGADGVLIASRQEPCGLAHFMAMRYGAVPLVTDVGGLAESVADFEPSGGVGEGILFAPGSAPAIQAALERLIAYRRDERAWTKLRSNAMRRLRTWSAAAEEMIRVYRQAL